MTGDFDNILAKHEDSGGMSLTKHLESVSKVAVVIARHLGMDENLAYKGAIMHDIGKTSPLFQHSMHSGYNPPPDFVFRHEIASLFFLSLFAENERPAIIDMIVAHHKSVYNDVGRKGLLDLDGDMDCFGRHSEKFAEWSETALQILELFGIKTHKISIEEAEINYEFAVEYCQKKQYNYSKWKGLLMAADHYASALEEKMELTIDKLFIKPDLSFYNRQSVVVNIRKRQPPSYFGNRPYGCGKN